MSEQKKISLGIKKKESCVNDTKAVNALKGPENRDPINKKPIVIKHNIENQKRAEETENLPNILNFIFLIIILLNRFLVEVEIPV